MFLTTLAYPIKGTPYFDRVAGRIIPLKPWEQGSDRDLTVAGRHSRRFYSFANRWLVSEVSRHRLGRGEQRNPFEADKTSASGLVGWLGMRLTAREVEAG